MPLPEGYYPDAEESVPLFKGTTGGTNYAVGFLWGFLSVWLFNLNFVLVEWTILSVIVGIGCYILWLVLLIRRYRHPFNDPQIDLILEKAKARIGFDDEVELWLRESPNLVCTSSRSPLHTAILMSKTAIQDICNNPIDGEIVLATKIMALKRIHPIILLAGTGASFLFGTTFGLSTSGFDPFSIFEDRVLGSFIIAISMLLIFGLCLLPFIFESKTDIVNQRIEAIYRVPPVVASSRVFGRQRIDDDQIEEFMRYADPKIAQDQKIKKTKKEMKRLVISMAVITASTIITVIGFGMINLPASIFAFVIPITLGATVYILLLAKDESRFMFRDKPDDEDTSTE
ncbi:MAG: hypothetical protein ACFFED_05740 [Candidatus Thorarchaeota archaeon]